MVDTIRNEKLEVRVKRFGAELTSLRTVDDNVEFLWQADAKYWTSQSINLFPIVGGLPGGKYELDGVAYKMESHGFAKNMEFDLVEKKQDTLVYKIMHDEKTLRQYPFKFELYVKYTIENNKLRHGYIVKNLDDRVMLFSVGAHPGFNCPLNKNEKMEDYSLVFEKPEMLKCRIKGKEILTGEREVFMDNEREKPLSHKLFYTGAAILDNVKSKWLEIINSVNKHTIRVEFEGFPYLGIWSAMNDAPFVCIEPWYGIDSTEGDPYDFTKKEGLQQLLPGSCFECGYSIILN